MAKLRKKSSQRKLSVYKELAESANAGEFLWLISLSDLMILLFVFFVVLFSFAYQKMGAADFSRMGEIIRGDKKKDSPLDQVQASLVKSLGESDLLESVEIIKKDDALVLQIKEKVLFNSGEYDLKPESVQILKLISKSLEKVPSPYQFGIEGHTDDVPISKPGISDNWELSAKRAHSVLETLNFSDGLKKRSVIMGYGEMNPLLPNRDPSGKPIEANQLKNRRVTIRVY